MRAWATTPYKLLTPLQGEPHARPRGSPLLLMPLAAPVPERFPPAPPQPRSPGSPRSRPLSRPRPSSLSLQGRLGRTTPRPEQGGSARHPALHRHQQPHGKRKLLPLPLCGRTDGTSRPQLSHCFLRGGSAQRWLLSPRLPPAVVSFARPPWRVRAGLAVQHPLSPGFRSLVSPLTPPRERSGRGDAAPGGSARCCFAEPELS